MPKIVKIEDPERSKLIFTVLRYITELVYKESKKRKVSAAAFFLNYYANVLAFCKDLMEVAHRSVIEFLKNEEKENGVGG